MYMRVRSRIEWGGMRERDGVGMEGVEVAVGYWKVQG